MPISWLNAVALDLAVCLEVWVEGQKKDKPETITDFEWDNIDCDADANDCIDENMNQLSHSNHYWGTDQCYN